MTQRKDGPAGYDNDQQRVTNPGSSEPMYEKGSAMERGTAHEFSTEQRTHAGAKDLRAVDPAPNAKQKQSQSGVGAPVTHKDGHKP